MAGAEQHEPSEKEIRLVIAASSAGTIFEWYDFFIYGTLAGLIGAAFFPSDNDTLEVLLVWAGFAVGFGFRPLGAILFGFLGDRLGRKYTFLITVTLMGVATAGVGLIPGAASIGIAAPLIVIGLRILQGLALGGEYGGAAIYVAEHAPAEKRGFYTGFIQASVVGGFVMSILVVLACRAFIPPDDFAAWGWRIPFLLSIVLLAISLWMRLKLNESPVFQRMKAAGQTARNPFVESFTYPGNKRRILTAFGVTGVLTTIWYTAFFSALSFLRGPMRVDESLVEWIMLAGGAISMIFYPLVGAWSDRVGRKLPIILGGGLALALMFPIFWGLGALANPGLSQSAQTQPVQISGMRCDYDPFAERQASECGRLLANLTALGVAYDLTDHDGPEGLRVFVGASELPPQALRSAELESAEARAGLRAALEERGYDLGPQTPSPARILGIIALVVAMGGLSALTYGSVAALLAELFPPQIRYSSMSIPYHISAGYLGGFLPLIAAYIVAMAGNPFAGLWYTWVVVAIGLVICWWGIPNGPPRDFEEASREQPPVGPAMP